MGTKATNCLPNSTSKRILLHSRVHTKAWSKNESWLIQIVTGNSKQEKVDLDVPLTGIPDLIGEWNLLAAWVKITHVPPSTFVAPPTSTTP